MPFFPSSCLEMPYHTPPMTPTSTIYHDIYLDLHMICIFVIVSTLVWLLDEPLIHFFCLFDTWCGRVCTSTLDLSVKLSCDPRVTGSCFESFELGHLHDVSWEQTVTRGKPDSAYDRDTRLLSSGIRG
jgi:hypothetical protein